MCMDALLYSQRGVGSQKNANCNDTRVCQIHNIKSRPLNSRIFSGMCQEMGSDHEHLLLHCEIKYEAFAIEWCTKRKHAEENKRKIAETISKTKKLTSFFRPPQSGPPPSDDIPIPGTSKNSEENYTIQEPCDSEFETLNNTEDIINETEINTAPNQENDPGLWLEFSNVDLEYWLSCGPNDCQNHNSSFEKSRRTYGSTSRYCHEKVFIGRKPNGENYKREWLLYSPSTGS
ncbi:unnamed protein product [Diatraea saccharalis]|uniref:Uncharacterized protein n=1 Tax=Diatraea saccharalis TaxID=40085 RepID=A0A9N9WHQ7_9NEOP|nr:unnamed protein product [Diatraea saccharalis]